MSEKHHYHLFALLLTLLQHIRSLIILVVIVFFQWRNIYGITGLIVVFGLTLIFSLISYLRGYYQLTEEHLIVYSGLFNRREVMIPYERIQTIKQQQWFFFKPFRLVRLSIETAGGIAGQAEAVLPAVPESVMQQLEWYRHKGNQTVKHYQRLYEISNGKIFLFSITNLGMLAGIFAVGATIEEVVPGNWYTRLWSFGVTTFASGWWAVAIVIVGSLLLFAIVTILKNFVIYYQFRVTREKNTLTIESGLLERKVQKIPLSKIQGIKIHQQLLRQIFGLVSVELLLASGKELDEEESTLFLLPIIYQKEVYKVLDFLLPEWQFEIPEFHYISRDKRWYFFRIPLAVSLPVSVALSLIRPWLGLVGILLLFLGCFLADLKRRHQGYVVQSTSRICIQTYQLFTRFQTVIERSKIQSFTEKTSKWLYRKKIGHLTFYYKIGEGNGSVSLRFIDQSEIRCLKRFYQQKKE